MNRELIYKYMKHPELLNDRSQEELQQVLDEFPFFQSVRLLLTKNYHNQGNIKYDKELKKTAVWTTDRRKLFFLLDRRVLLPVDDDYISIPPPESVTKEIDDKTDIIDFSELTEVTEIAKTKQVQPERNEIDELLASTTVPNTFFDVSNNVDLNDFKNTFGKKDNKATDEDIISEKDLLIDKFITENPKISPIKNTEAPQPDVSLHEHGESSSLMSETLIKIFIKQGHYDKAISSYEKLSLKYPEKNTYFADQIEKIKELANKK